jgi:DNA invertase Pin-like site-specific DNA recombinase
MTMPTTAKRCISYVRFSRRDQAGGAGRARQLELSAAWCQTHGYALDDSLHLEDLGVSAFRSKHATEGALAGFLQAVKGGRVKRGTVLLVESLDRLSRDQIGTALSQFLDLLGRGVEIVTFVPERHYTPASINDLGSLLEPLVIMSRAYEESKMKSHRSKDAWSRKRRAVTEGRLAVYGHAPPAWLTPQADGSGYRLVPDRAKAVRLMFDLAEEGHGVRAIAIHLRAKRVPSWTGRDWTARAVQRILRSRVTIGEWQTYYEGEVPRDPKDPDGTTAKRRLPVGDPVPGHYPAAVTEGQFQRVQDALGRRLVSRRGRKGKDVANLFTGLLHDARDGTPMHLSKEHDRKGTTKLVSSGAVKGLEGSSYAAFPYPLFEDAFLTFVSELKPSDVAGPGPDGPDGLADEQAALAGRLADLDAKIARWEDQLVEADQDQEAALQGTLAKARGRRREAAARLETVKAELAHDRPALGEVKTCAALLGTTEPGSGERAALRGKIKSAVSRLVEEIHLLVWDASPRTRACDAQVFLTGGQVREFVVWRILPSRHDHSAAHASGVTNQKGQAADDLRRYRDDPEMREAWARKLADQAALLRRYEDAQVELWRLARIAERPPAVTRILTLRESGMRWKDVLADLNERKVPAPGGGRWGGISQLVRLVKKYAVDPEESEP